MVAALLANAIPYTLFATSPTESYRPLDLPAGQPIAAAGPLILASPFGGLAAPTWQSDAVTALIVLGVLGTGVA